jgi:hypothetical protein
MIGKVGGLWKGTSSAAVEWGLIAAGVALVLITTVAPNTYKPIAVLFAVWLALNGLFFVWLVRQAFRKRRWGEPSVRRPAVLPYANGRN